MDIFKAIKEGEKRAPVFYATEDHVKGRLLPDARICSFDSEQAARDWLTQDLYKGFTKVVRAHVRTPWREARRDDIIDLHPFRIEDCTLVHVNEKVFIFPEVNILCAYEVYP